MKSEAPRDKVHRYGGKCRSCGFHGEWVVKASGQYAHVDYSKDMMLSEGMADRNFIALMRRPEYYPLFMAWCENCHDNAVHELTFVRSYRDSLNRQERIEADCS